MADSTQNKLVIEDKLDAKKLRDLWSRRVESVKKFITDRYTKETAKYMKLYRNELAGMLPEALLSQDVGVDVNVIFPIVKQLIPNLYFQNPKVFVTSEEDKIIHEQKDDKGKPVTDLQGKPVVEEFDGHEAASKFQRTLNDDIRDGGLKQTIKSSILDAHLGFYGAVKIGWNNEQGVGSMNGEAPPSFRTEVSKDKPFVIRLKPWNVLPDMADFYNPQWMAIRYTVPPIFLQQDTRLRHTEQIKGNADLSQEEKRKFWQLMEKEDLVLTEYYEIYVRPSANYPRGKYFILSPEVSDDFLFSGEWPYDFFDPTIQLLFFNRDPEGGLPIPDVRYYFGQQKAKSNLRRTEYEYVQRTTPGVVVNMSNVSDSTKLRKQLESNRVPRVIEASGNVNNVIAAATFPSLNPQFGNFNKIIDDDVARLSQQFKGVFAPGGGSNVEFAKVAELSAEGEQISMTEKADVVRDFVTKIVTVMGKLRESLGENKEFQAKFKYEVQPFSMQFENPTVLRRQLTDILNLLGSPQIQNELQKAGKRADLAKNIEMIIGTFPNREYESLIIDEVETCPGQVILAMKENQTLEQGQQVPVNETDMHEVHILIHGLLGEKSLEHMQAHQERMQQGNAGKSGGGNVDGLPVNGVATSQEQIREPLNPSATNQTAAINRETGTR